MTLTPGTNLYGHEAPGRLGAGGTGEVYRACDPWLTSDVAVRELRPYALDGEVLETYALRRNPGNDDPLRDDGREKEWR